MLAIVVEQECPHRKAVRCSCSHSQRDKAHRPCEHNDSGRPSNIHQHHTASWPGGTSGHRLARLPRRAARRGPTASDLVQAAIAGSNATVPAGAYLVTQTPTGTVLNPIIRADNSTAANATAVTAAPAVQQQSQQLPGQVAATSVPTGTASFSAPQVAGTTAVPGASPATGAVQNDYRAAGVPQS